VTPNPPTPARERLGVFGGTFDPIHIAHLVIAQEALIQLRLDRVLFVPTGDPPHKHDRMISAPEHRRAMVALAIADNDRFVLSTVELERPGRSYTVDTLAQLHEQYGTASLFLLLGGDMVYDVVNWHAPAGIVNAVSGIVALQRPGYTFHPADIAALDARLPGLGTRLLPLEAPLLAISSTLIRERVAHDIPVRYLVPAAVDAYITTMGLYRTPSLVDKEDAR